MLQWMGGSRRKVTTSRKSTQKRQKQFFEQRKRRQQQQMTMVIENYADRLNNCNQHQKNNRSLDILSLLNVPKVSEECRSICPRELNASPLNCCMTEDMPQLATDKFTPANSLESTRLRTLSSCQVENVSPERLPLGASNSSKYAYMGRVNNLKDCNIASSHRLSVFDLFGDDGTSDNSEGTLVPESHVAFSVEGLGKLGRETPIHSSQPSSRTLSGGPSLLAKASRLHNSSKNFHYALNDPEMEVESLLRGDFVPFSCNYLDSGCQREGAVDSFSYKTHEVLSAKDQMKDHNNCKMNALADEEVLYDIQGKNANFWNATSPLLYDSFLNTEYDITWKSSGSADSFGINNYDMQDFLSYLPKRGPEKSIDRYHVLDSYAQYLKHQTMEDLHFLTSRESKYSAFGRNSDSPSNQYSWSYLIAEDARDSLRSLSGESCSTSAVRPEGISDTSPVKCSRRYSKDPHVASKRVSLRNNNNHRVRGVVGQEEKCEGLGKFSMTSNPSTVEYFYAALPTFNLKLGDEDHCLFEDGYSSVCLNPHLHLLHGSFYQSSEKEDNVSPCHKSCTEDPIGGFVPDLHFNSKLLFDTSKCDAYVGCPPPDDPAGLSFCSVQSFNSSVFSKVGFGQKGKDILQDIEIHVQSSGLSEVGGSYRDTEFPTPGLSEEGSVTKDEANKSKSQLSDHEIVKLEKDTYVGNKEILSERMTMENSNSNAYDKVKDFILEVAASSIDAEGSLSLKTEELESKERRCMSEG